MCSRLRGYLGNSSHPGVSIFNGEIRPGRAFKTNIYPASFAIRFFQVEGNKDEIYHRVVHAWWPVLTGRERSMWKPEGLEHKQNPPGLRVSTSLSSFMELNSLSISMALDSGFFQTSILSAPLSLFCPSLPLPGTLHMIHRWATWMPSS